MITGGKVRLCPKRLDDAARDYFWQTDPGLTKLDASSPLAMKFAQYLAKYTGELGCNGQDKHQFAIDTLDGEHIGNCAYYAIDETKGEAELGIMIGDRNYWSGGYGADTITTLVNHIFRQTEFNRLYLKTLGSNLRAQKCFQKCGFHTYGQMARDGYSFILMEIRRQQWQRRQEQGISEGNPSA